MSTRDTFAYLIRGFNRDILESIARFNLEGQPATNKDIYKFSIKKTTQKNGQIYHGPSGISDDNGSLK